MHGQPALREKLFQEFGPISRLYAVTSRIRPDLFGQIIESNLPSVHSLVNDRRYVTSIYVPVKQITDGPHRSGDWKTIERCYVRLAQRGLSQPYTWVTHRPSSRNCYFDSDVRQVAESMESGSRLMRDHTAIRIEFGAFPGSRPGTQTQPDCLFQAGIGCGRRDHSVHPVPYRLQ